MGGGGEDELTGETPAPPGDSEESMTGAGEFDEEAAWEAFFEWSMAQCWGSDCETSGAEQFAAMVAKLRELGLPVGSLMP